MSNERITAAEYRQIAEGLGNLKKAQRAPRRGAEGTNPYVGLRCWVCGAPVLQRQPADQLTEILASGATGRVRVRHLNAEDCKSAA